MVKDTIFKRKPGEALRATVVVGVVVVLSARRDLLCRV
jgi:hypothetical protein